MFYMAQFANPVILTHRLKFNQDGGTKLERVDILGAGCGAEEVVKNSVFMG
jgi:hypothetical protein